MGNERLKVDKVISLKWKWVEEKKTLVCFSFKQWKSWNKFAFSTVNLFMVFILTLCYLNKKLQNFNDWNHDKYANKI